MQTIDATAPFNFTYTAFGQEMGLFISAKIYNIVTGSAVFVDDVPMTDTIGGVYEGSYQGIAGAVYLVISAIYTDNTYATLADEAAPQADIYKTLDAPVGFLAFNYGAYDRDEDLVLAGNVYNVTVSPTFLARVAMPHVYAGVYFASYTGTLSNSYLAAKLVYTDNTYAVIDTDRSPGADSFQVFDIPLNVFNTYFNSAVLIAQTTEATLTGQESEATLIEAQC